MWGAGFDGEGDGFNLLHAAGAHQAGGPAHLPAGGAVPAHIQAPGEPEVIILQATEVGGAPPILQHLQHEKTTRSSTMQVTPSVLQLPPPVPTAASLAAGQVKMA